MQQSLSGLYQILPFELFSLNFWTNRNKYKGFSASLPLDGTVQRTKTIVASVWTKFWLFRAKTMICLRYSKYFYLLCDTLYSHFCQMAKKFNKEYTLFHSRPIGKCTWIMKMSSKLTLFEVDWFSVARNQKVIRERPYWRIASISLCVRLDCRDNMVSCARRSLLFKMKIFINFNRISFL